MNRGELTLVAGLSVIIVALAVLLTAHHISSPDFESAAVRAVGR